MVVMITSEEYKELILKGKELEVVIKDCENQISDLKKEFSGVENYIFNHIYDTEQWDIKNLEFENGAIVEEYHYKELVQAFAKKGITNIDYISKKILELYERYEKEKGGNNENN